MPQGTPNVILMADDVKRERSLVRTLRATGASVACARDPDALDSYSHYQLVVVDYADRPDACLELVRDLSERDIKAPLLVVSSTKEKEWLVDLFSQGALTNIVAKNEDLTHGELVITVQKILRDSVFGVEKYLTWGIDPYYRTITSSRERSETIDDLQDFLDGIGLGRRMSALAITVADEFLMNAIFDAPVDAAGVTKYADLDRSTKFDLQPNEYVRFAYACDGINLAISTEDGFGKLRRETVLHYLRKAFAKGEDQIDDKPGGAGIGLFHAFESLNHLVINIEPDRRTEMIGLINITGSVKQFSDKSKSLNFFVTRG